MTISTNKPYKQNPKDLGTRYAGIVHSILYASDLVLAGVHEKPFRERDERTSIFEAAAASVLEQADELEKISDLLKGLDGAGARKFLRGTHADNVQRLRRSWDLAEYRLRWPCQELPQKVVRELDANPRQWVEPEDGDGLGVRYADLICWSVESLRDLHLSSLYPNRHKGKDEASLKQDIRHSKAVLSDVLTTGAAFEWLTDEDLRLVLNGFDAKIRVRARSSVNEVPRRLQPFMH